MADHRVEDWARLLTEGEAHLRTAGAAVRASQSSGRDTTGSVTTRLDRTGRIASVSVASGWKRQVGVEGLADAVIEAVHDAAEHQLTAWGQAYGEHPDPADAADAATGSAGTNHIAGDTGLDRDSYRQRLQDIMAVPMPATDRHAALTELLTWFEAIERGIDEVSGKLDAALNTTYTGRSPDHHVSITVTGGGEVTGVRLNRTWLREAHEANIGRQVTAAFHAVYEQLTAHGVTKLVADSALGQVQRATQDPYEMARRLRLTD